MKMPGNIEFPGISRSRSTRSSVVYRLRLWPGCDLVVRDCGPVDVYGPTCERGGGGHVGEVERELAFAFTGPFDVGEYVACREHGVEDHTEDIDAWREAGGTPPWLSPSAWG